MKRIAAFALAILLLSLAACSAAIGKREAMAGGTAHTTGPDVSTAYDSKDAWLDSLPSIDTPADKSGTPFLLFGTQLVLNMPADWSFFYQLDDSAPWAFFSPEADAEFDVFPLDIQEGETVDDSFDSLAERYEAGEAGVRELEKLDLNGCRCLVYVDDIGQDCAYIKRSDSEGYYISCTGQGDGGQFFRERLRSIRWIAEGAPSPYVRETEGYEGYEFELGRVGLKAYIPNEYSFVEYDEEYQLYKFATADGTKKLVASCGYAGGHTSPNHTAEFMWDVNSRDPDIRMTAEASSGGRMYAFWQERSTGKLKETYVLGNHGYTVNFYGALSVGQMRYFIDRLEDIEVSGDIQTGADDFEDEFSGDDVGSGYTVDDDRCGVCGGSGICVGCHGRRRTRIPGYGGVGTAKYVDCGACGGSGRCRTCDGTGRK